MCIGTCSLSQGFFHRLQSMSDKTGCMVNEFNFLRSRLRFENATGFSINYTNECLYISPFNYPSSAPQKPTFGSVCFR